MDPHKVLGIQPGASPAEIKAAYRRAAQKYHPDAGGDAWVFQQVQLAFEQLSAGAPATAAATAQSASPNHAAARSGAKADSAQDTAPKNPGGKSSRSTDISPIERIRLRLKSWVHLVARRELPLQTETSLFILANMLDFFCTYILLQLNAIEANPFANFVFIRWGFAGMLHFKLLLVAGVCVLAQLIAAQRPRYGQGVLVVGTTIVGLVVAYSLLLLRGQLA